MCPSVVVGGRFPVFGKILRCTSCHVTVGMVQLTMIGVDYDKLISRSSLCFPVVAIYVEWTECEYASCINPDEQYQSKEFHRKHVGLVLIGLVRFHTLRESVRQRTFSHLTRAYMLWWIESIYHKAVTVLFGTMSR